MGQEIARETFMGARRSEKLLKDCSVIAPTSFRETSTTPGGLSAWVPRFRWIVKTVSLISRQQALVAVIVAAVILTAGRGTAFSVQLAQDEPQSTQSAPLTPAALQQLLAPIALYPDALVAQILAASTYPSEIVEADRWVQEHSKLKDDKLAKEVDKQSWDPSIKALTPFPSVLANLDTNLSWTSALGDAYFNQQQDVLDALQSLRRRAEDAGHLQSTSQQTVTSQGTTIIIEPADPDVCYLPSYNPWLVYGAPIGMYPDYLYESLFEGPYVSFGLGIGIGGGFWGGFGWGWDAWGFNWRNRSVIFNHNNYVSRSRTFFNRSSGGDGNLGRGQGRPSVQGNHEPGDVGRNRDGAFHDGSSNQRSSPDSDFGHGGRGTQPIGNPENRHDFRGFGQPGPDTGIRSGAFSGFGQGGIERGSASRGRASIGGGGIGGGGIGGGGIGGGGFGGGRGGGGGGSRGGGGGHGGGRH
jgi:hypothetical protein